MTKASSLHDQIIAELKAEDQKEYRGEQYPPTITYTILEVPIQIREGKVVTFGPRHTA